MKTKKGIPMTIAILIILWCLPIISGRVSPLPESLNPSALGRWLGEIISYWIELIKAFLKQIRIWFN